MTAEGCPECGGLGWRRLAPEAAPGAPNYGRLVACACNRVEQARRQQAPTRFAGLPARLQTRTFESFVVLDEAAPPQGRGSNRAAYTAARTFAAGPQGWLLFSGPPGGGKTHLLAAIAQVIQCAGGGALFVTAPDLLDLLRAGYDQSDFGYEARLEQVRTVAVLLLDDLGAEAPTPWAAEKLFQLLNYRYNWGWPTVLATNFPLKTLEPRLRSRLTERGLVQHVPLMLADLRPQAQGLRAF